MLTTAKKVLLGNETKEINGRNSFSIGNYCAYVGTKKEQAVEHVIDITMPKMNEPKIFLYENLAKREIYIVFVHSNIQTIVLNMEHDFSWEKLNSMLATQIIKCGADEKIYMLDSSKIKEKITLGKFFLDDGKFYKEVKYTPKMVPFGTYVRKYSIAFVLLIAFLVAQYKVFDYVNSKGRDAFNKEMKQLQIDKTQNIMTAQKTQKEINEFKHQTANDWQEVFNTAGFQPKPQGVVNRGVQ